MRCFVMTLAGLIVGAWVARGAAGAEPEAPKRMAPEEIVAGLDPALLKTVCARPFGFNVTPDLVDLFNEHATEGDFAKMGARDIDAILSIQRGRIIVQLGQAGERPERPPRPEGARPEAAGRERPRREPPAAKAETATQGASASEPAAANLGAAAAARPRGERVPRTDRTRGERPAPRERGEAASRPARAPGEEPPAPSGPPEPLPEKIRDKAEFVSLSERSTLEELTKLAAEYRKQGKKTVCAPTGEIALRETPENLAARARNADLFIVQAERWIYEDKSKDFGECIPRIHGLIEAVKKANPKCIIGVEIGRREDRGGGTAQLFLRFFTRYETVHPGEIGMNYLFITRQTPKDPNMGLNALRDYLSIARPKGAAAEEKNM